jgi:hypothetical protein
LSIYSRHWSWRSLKFKEGKLPLFIANCTRQSTVYVKNSGSFEPELSIFNLCLFNAPALSQLFLQRSTSKHPIFFSVTWPANARVFSPLFLRGPWGRGCRLEWMRQISHILSWGYVIYVNSNQSTLNWISNPSALKSVSDTVGSILRGFKGTAQI